MPRSLSVSVLCAALAWLGAGMAAAELSPAALEALELIKSDDDYEQQLGFLRLEALRERESAEAIRGYAASRDPVLRAWTLRALAAIQGVEAAPDLLARLKTERQAGVRRAIILGLEPYAAADSQILTVLIDALRDPHVEVRMAAVDIVSRLDAPQAKEAVRERYRRERNRDVRRVLDTAIDRVGRP